MKIRLRHKFLTRLSFQLPVIKRKLATKFVCARARTDPSIIEIDRARMLAVCRGAHVYKRRIDRCHGAFVSGLDEKVHRRNDEKHKVHPKKIAFLRVFFLTHSRIRRTPGIVETLSTRFAARVFPPRVDPTFESDFQASVLSCVKFLSPFARDVCIGART